jgi:hypothetical protein
MLAIADDIFTEPDPVDPDTLKNLGPLAPLAGIWEGQRGVDIHPVVTGTKQEAFLERYELQPIDPQTNGPQLLYGLRYWTFITRPDRPGTFHDQVGYWLWEPATGMIIQSHTIPRGMTALAIGQAAADARVFELRCTVGSVTDGICSNPYLDAAFRTVEFSIRVEVHDDGTWSYEQDTVLKMHGQAELFHHIDRNTLHRVAAPTANPLLRAQR